MINTERLYLQNKANTKAIIATERHLRPCFDTMIKCEKMYAPQNCSKSIDIRVDVAIATSCIIYVDEQTSPFLDRLVLNTTCYSDSCSYKSENILSLPFSPQFLT